MADLRYPMPNNCLSESTFNGSKNYSFFLLRENLRRTYRCGFTGTYPPNNRLVISLWLGRVGIGAVRGG